MNEGMRMETEKRRRETIHDSVCIGDCSNEDSSRREMVARIVDETSENIREGTIGREE